MVSKYEKFTKEILSITSNQEQRVREVEQRISDRLREIDSKIAVLSEKAMAVRLLAENGAHSCKVDVTFISEEAIPKEEQVKRVNELSAVINELMDHYQVSYINAKQLKVHKKRKSLSIHF